MSDQQYNLLDMLTGRTPTQTTGYKGTSRAAWETAKTKGAEMKRRIIDHLENRPGGATDEEIGDALNTAETRSNRPARLELRNEGYIRDTGTRRKTVSGSQAIVWERTPDDEVDSQRESLALMMLRKEVKERLSSLGWSDLREVAALIDDMECRL
jgi:hypothetical protein